MDVHAIIIKTLFKVPMVEILVLPLLSSSLLTFTVLSPTSSFLPLFFIALDALSCHAVLHRWNVRKSIEKHLRNT